MKQFKLCSIVENKCKFAFIYCLKFVCFFFLFVFVVKKKKITCKKF